MRKPFYILDEDAFRKNIVDIRNAFKAVYGNFHIGYSFKTNYVKNFIDIVRDEGEFAEVVSSEEVKVAIQQQFKCKHIIWNGPLREYDDKYKLLFNGAIVNVDNIIQLNELLAFARIHEDMCKIGVRLNFDIDNGIVSRFGIDVNGEDYKELKSLVDDGEVEINCVHCHFTKARSLKHFQNRIENMIRYADELGASIIDVGGNMFGPMDEKFRKQFMDNVPTFDEYARVIAGNMKKAYPNEDKMLIIECGTPVVANAMHLACHVINIKTIQGQTFVDLDVKREDIGAACATMDPVVDIYGRKKSHVEHAIFCACSCVESDRVVRDFNGNVSVNDLVVFRNIGAYSVNMANDFIIKKIDDFVPNEEFVKMLQNKEEGI